jgi:sugar phosphate isomerase/epimerase
MFQAIAPPFNRRWSNCLNNLITKTLKRRKFIQQSSLGTATLLATTLESYAVKHANTSSSTGYQLLILATDWGFEGSRDQFFAMIKNDGFDGAELWCPDEPKDLEALVNAAQKYNMEFGLLLGPGDVNPDTNLIQFIAAIDKAIKLKPLYINCHTGKDFFSYDDLLPYFEYTIEASTKSGIPIYHETHRGRALYNTQITKKMIEKLPELKITGDFSHWCVVHESLLADQEDTMDIAIERTEHIHARIGFSEGPQVNDPRAPEWESAVNAHFAWWDKIVDRKKQKGERLTILTEFGPPDYMPTLPYTRQAVANQHEINLYMKKILKKRYG